MTMRGTSISKVGAWPQALLRRLRRSRFHSDRRGVSAVEFALITPILVLIIAGIIDGGALFYLQNNMANVARDTVRRLSVGEISSSSDAQTFASSHILNWGATFTVNVTEPDPDDVNDTDYVVEITVPIDDAALMDPFNFFNSGTLRARAVMRQE